MVRELLPVSPEDPRQNLAILALPGQRALALALQQGAKCRRGRDRKEAPFAVLGRTRLESYRAGVKIDLRPSQTLNFPDAPARSPGELDRRRVPIWELCEHSHDLFVGEEALPHVVELECRQGRLHRELSGEHGQLQHPAERGDLVVDSPSGGVFPNSHRDVPRNAVIGDFDGWDALEDWP